MADPARKHRLSRVRSAALPWIGRSREPARADGLPASPAATPRRLVGLVGAGVFALILVIGAAWLAIQHMPLPASQVIPRVKTAIEQRLGPDYAVAIEDAELHRGAAGIELRLVDLEIAKADGGPVIASVPRAELNLDGLGLFGGDVGVTSVHLTNPKLDMRLDVTMDAASKNSDLPSHILAAVGDLDRLLGADGAAGALQEVVVNGATLVVASQSRAPLALDGVDLRLSRGAGGSIALTTSSSRPGDRWTTAVTVTAPADDKARTVDLGLENVDLAPYSAPLAEKAGASPVTGRVSGHFSARIGADGRLLAGDGRLDGRAIVVAMPGPAVETGGPPRSVAIDRIQLALGWDAASRTLKIEPSQLRSRGGQMSFTGAFSAPQRPGAPWLATFDGRDVLLASERAGEAPLRLDRIGIAASFDPTAGALEISKAEFLGPTAKAAASGSVRFEGASPAIRLGLVSDPMPSSAVKRLWPFFLASSVREWVIDNVGAGRIDGVSLTIDVPAGALATLGPHDPLPDGSMALEVLFSEGSLRGGADMPWIEGASGRVDATARTVVATVNEGYVAGLGEEGPVTIRDARFTVPDLAPRMPKAQLTLKADGSLRRALSMVASGAFGPSPVPALIDVAKVSGKVAADVTAGFELGHAPGDAPKPQVRVSAQLSEVRIADVFAGRDFEKGSFRLEAADGPPTLVGKGVVSGAPATVAVSGTPGTATAPARRKLAVALTADAGDLTRLGLDVPGSITGSVPLTADFALDEPGAPFAVKADLTSVGIDGLVPGFRKPAGKAGRLGFIVEKTAERTQIKDFALESGDRGVRGTIEFGPKGDLIAATLPIYRPAPGDDAKVDIDRTKGGVTKVAVQGAALDLKPLLDAARGKSSGGARTKASDAGSAPKNLDVSAKLGTGLGYGDEAVAGLDIKLAVRDGKVTDADGAGRIGAGAIRIATGEGGRLNLAGGDAGAFFRFADLYGRIDGGVFDLAASLSGGPGVLRIRDFSVLNETTLDRVSQTTGADREAPAAARGATKFSRLRVAFVQGGGVIKVNEATVYGPTLGATLEGSVNYAANKVDLVGTFVPIYALNNLLSRVPLIGELLGGGKNGGLVGVTFQVKGPTTAPTVTVNPMSAVAPGFLRRMFEYRQEGQASDPATGATSRETAQ
jgi:hypothetical protein